MTARVLCPALDAMLKKTIIALCEVNVQYNVCLEISGSLHIRADGERVFNCLIEEELNGKEKKTRKESLNDIAGFSIDLAKLHRDSMDSFTERDDEFEADDLGCFNLPQGELRTDLTSEDEATLVEGTAQQEALEISSTSSSQCSKSPAFADVTAATTPDLDTVTAAPNIVTPTLPVSQAKSNLAAIFPTPKVEPTVTSTQNRLPTPAYQNTNLTSSTSSEGTNQNTLAGSTACNIAAAATANPNLNLQAVAIAAAIQRAAEASKRNIGMVLPTQNPPVPTSIAPTPTTNVTVDNNQIQQSNDIIQTNPVTVKQEEQSDGDLPLPPIGLNFQLALFQNQMAQIQMMQAANASAMLNMGTNVGLNTLNAAAGMNGPNAVSTSALGPGLVGGLTALGATVNPVPAVTSSAPAETPPSVSAAVSTPAVSKSTKTPISVGNPVRTTTGAKKWQCGFCGILVSSKFYLSSHINAVHTRTRIYPCEICGRLFYSHGAQRIHKLRYHWVDKRHKCPQCNQMFVLPVELRQHIQRKHKHALM